MTSKHTQNSLPFDIGVRVSRVGAREGDSFISPSLQLRRARDHADARGLKVGVVFEELDVSGGDPDRPDLELAVRRVEEGKSGGIIVLRFDRFARDMAVWAGCLKRIQDAGGTVLSVLEGADLRTPDGRTMANMLMSIAQGQRENAVLNFADGRREAIKRGVHICPVPPAGYARESGMPLHPDPAAAPVISELFDRAAAGESWSTLARWLEAQGVRTAYGNAGWSPIGVKRLVRNRAYLGIAYHGEFERADSHPALTDRETWERAQRRQRQTRPRSQCRPWLLAGLVRCAGCRYVPAPFFARGKRRFKCRRCYPGGVCPAPVDALSGGLEDHVVDAFFAELGDIELQAAEADTARDQARRDLAAREAALNEFLTDTFFAEQLTKDEFAMRLAALRDAKAEAQDRLARLPARTTPSVVSLRAKWDGLSIEHKRRMLGSVIQAVFVRRAGRPGRHADAIHKRAKIIWRHEPELALPNLGASATNEIVPFDW